MSGKGPHKIMGVVRKEVKETELYAGMHKLLFQDMKLKEILCWYGQRKIVVLDDELKAVERRVGVHQVTQLPLLTFEAKQGGVWRATFRIPGMVAVDDWVQEPSSKRTRLYFHFLGDHPHPDYPTEMVVLELPRGRSIVELHFSPSLIKPNGYSGAILLLREDAPTTGSPNIMQWIAALRLNIPLPNQHSLRPLHKYHTPIFILPEETVKRQKVIENILKLCEDAKGPWPKTQIFTTIVSFSPLSSTETERLHEDGLKVIEVRTKENDQLGNLLQTSNKLFSAPAGDSLVLCSQEALAQAMGGSLAAVLGAELGRVPQYGSHSTQDPLWEAFLLYLGNQSLTFKRVFFVGRLETIQVDWAKTLLSMLYPGVNYRVLSPKDALEEIITHLKLDMIEFNALRGWQDRFQLENEVDKPLDILRWENSTILRGAFIYQLINPQLLVLATYRQKGIEEDLFVPFSYSVSRRAPMIPLSSPNQEAFVEIVRALNQVASTSEAVLRSRAKEDLKKEVFQLTARLFTTIPQDTRVVLNKTITRMVTAFTPEFLPFELASRKASEEELDPWGTLVSISRLSGGTLHKTCTLSAYSTLSCLKPWRGNQALIITNPTQDPNLAGCTWETGAVLPRMIVSGLDLDPTNDVLGAEKRLVEKGEAERRMENAAFIHYSGHGKLCFRGADETYDCEYYAKPECEKTGHRHRGCFPFYDAQSTDRWMPLPNNEVGPLRQSPFVFMNACHSGSPELARRFLEAGATGYIGTLWRVSDTIAALIGANFYEAIARSTITDALRQYRQALQKKFGLTDISWLAYIVYGDPAASTSLHTQDSLWEAHHFDVIAQDCKQRDELRAALFAHERAVQLARESYLMSDDDVSKQLARELEVKSAAYACDIRAQLEKTPRERVRLFQSAEKAYRRAARTAKYVNDRKENTSNAHVTEANAFITLAEVSPTKQNDYLLHAAQELYAASASHPKPETQQYYSALAAFYEAAALAAVPDTKDKKAIQRLFSALWCLDIASTKAGLPLNIEGGKRAIWAKVDRLLLRSVVARQTLRHTQEALTLSREAEGLYKSGESLRATRTLRQAAAVYGKAATKYFQAFTIYRRLSELSGSREYCRGMREYCLGLEEYCKNRYSYATTHLLNCCTILNEVREPLTQRRYAQAPSRKAEEVIASLWVDSIEAAKEGKEEWTLANDQYYNALSKTDLLVSKQLFANAATHFSTSAKGVRGPHQQFLEAFARRAKEGEIRSEAKAVEMGFLNARNGFPNLGLVEKLWKKAIQYLEEAKLMFPLDSYKKGAEEEMEGIKYDLYLCQQLSSGLRQAGNDQTE